MSRPQENHQISIFPPYWRWTAIKLSSQFIPAGPASTAIAGVTQSPAGTTARQGPLGEEGPSMTLPNPEWATVFTGCLFFPVLYYSV